jgi:uncharacterized protein (TIGR02117 family)
MRFIHYIGSFLRFLLSLLVLYFLIALLFMLFTPKRDNPNPDTNTTKTKILYLYHNPAHTELILPASELSEALKKLLTPYIPYIYSGYLAFSYGDADFMQKTPRWSDTDTPTALRALFLNTPGAIRVGHYRAIRQDEHLISIPLKTEALEKIEKAIYNSFQKEQGAPIPFKQRRTNSYIYYFHAKHPYNLIYTCNQWSRDILSAGSLPQPQWAPFSFGVVYPF